ncbi:MAG: hypothetical protein FWD26_03410 [Treponema sp.]|nr:hypothetical protein [Treponema sp.]
MKNKIFILGLAVLVLSLTVIFIGCEDATTEFEGTWTKRGDTTMKITFTGGNWNSNKLNAKGTFTSDSTTLYFTTTHINNVELDTSVDWDGAYHIDGDVLDLSGADFEHAGVSGTYDR